MGDRHRSSWSGLLDDFRWRVSRARIKADGPFSLFPGCERWITCLEGAGFALHFEDGVKLAVPPFVPSCFAGDRPALCRLAGGPCTDINVIARRDQVEVSVAVVAASPDLPEQIGSGRCGRRTKSWFESTNGERCGCVCKGSEGRGAQSLGAVAKWGVRVGTLENARTCRSIRLPPHFGQLTRQHLCFGGQPSGTPAIWRARQPG